ncbi:MAG: anthranilate phosphoribosyltransferase [Pseudonocardiales bacterium]
MHDALTALLHQRSSVPRETWRSLWDQLDQRNQDDKRDQLDEGGLHPGEATVLLASLATRLPDPETLRNLVASLHERRPAVAVHWPGSVNIVGTGGGPPTFNISTAAAFVAAALGVPVVKAGSRAYTSRYGSIDLLERLGVGLTSSYEHTSDTLDRFGIAFAGPFVYPTALTQLARRIVPMSMRPFGRFLNALGPFLAALPVTAQVTGVSEHAPLAELRQLAATISDRTFWLCTNDLGADELLGFADNLIYTGLTETGTSGIRLWPGRFTSGAGTLDDLRPVEDPGAVVKHFLDVMSGAAGEVATRTVCLNAAALAVAGGHLDDWPSAITAAEDAVRSGAARALVDRMRAIGHG